MSKEMQILYEKAWNSVVNKLPKWKKDIIVNHEDTDKDWKRVSDEVAKETIKLAQEWEYDKMSVAPSGNDNSYI